MKVEIELQVGYEHLFSRNIGLRILLFVNTTEYLPTTEAAGVRMTVHDKDDHPFPDTFGYSAPTGYISSFGIRLVLI